MNGESARERHPLEQRLHDDGRPVITAECGLWGSAYPHWLWHEGADHDEIRAAALAAVA